MNNNPENLNFDCEQLEDRKMLSSVDIFAAGTTNEETIELRIDGVTVQTWENIGGDANAGEFQKLSYSSDEKLDLSQIKIAFTNDLYDPAAGVDRNVRIDKVVLDGEQVETESAGVFSTGTWKPEDGITPGYRESEFLHANGFFQFQANEETSEVEIRARGHEGSEQFRLIIKGQNVGTFGVSSEYKTIRYVHSSGKLTADDIKIEFFGDEYDPAKGIDKNLTVDFVSIDGKRYETESPAVYSTGAWLPEDGIVPGYGRSDTLHGNGFFQFAEAEPTAGTDVEMRVRGHEGTEQFQLFVKGVLAGTFSVGTDFETILFRAEEGVNVDDIRIKFVNDQYDAAQGIDANLVVDYIRVGGTKYETESPAVYSTGTWRPMDGSAPGYGRGDTLHSNGYFQFAAEPPAPPLPEAGPNLIVNGSFEDNAVEGDRWVGLSADQVPGWNSYRGEKLEIWDSGYEGVVSTDGTNHLEIDFDAKRTTDGIYQDIRTEAGKFYQLTFDIRARGTNLISDDESIVVEWNGVKTKVDGYHAKVVGEWTRIRILLEGTGGTDRLLLRESKTEGASDATGPLLDNVSLSSVGKEFVSDKLLHSADGTVEMNSHTYHFHGKDLDGNFRYGAEALLDDATASYELTDHDIAFLVQQAQAGVVQATDLADVSDPSGIRNLDGFGNNVRNPLWGNADQVYARLVAANYADGEGEPRTGPNPRDISNAIFNQNKDGITNLFGPNAGDNDLDLPNQFRGSEFVAAFGQYFDHGLGFLPKGGTNSDGTEAGSMNIGNAQFPLTLTRGSVEPGTGIDGVAREHPNQTSPFIDQNQAYGSNDAILEFLLERDENGQFTGRLFASPEGGLPNLGELKVNWQRGVDAGLAEAIDFDDPQTISNFRGSGDALLLDINPRVDLDLHLVAGDGRVNENASLSVVHQIWHENHNFWVEHILTYFHENGGVPSDLSTEDVFNMAKIVNEGEYQRAVFDEFVELLVGSDVHSFMDYNPNINADLTHEFAAAAYRLGHSLLNNYITVRVDSADNVAFSKDDTVEVPLFDLFLNPTKFRELGAADIMAGMTTSLNQEIDAKMVTTLRNNLVGRPLDLASLNIGRGRDVGLPTLNEMRDAVGLSTYKDWDDFASNLRNSSDLAKFKQLYQNVDDIDLWVGGLAEKPSSSDGFGTELGVNTVMGETFTQVFSTQMIALQDGDRFYYKHRLFETDLRQNMQNQDFADIVERTLGLEYLHADILKTIDNRFDFRDVDQTKLELSGTSGHDVIIARNIGETIHGKDGDDTIHAKAGDDIVYGGEGDDALHGGAGNDILIGEDGDDRADGGTGDDIIRTGHGDDDIAGNDGDDYLDVGEDDDEAFGGNGNDTILGGSGNDNLWGGRGSDIVEGGSGDDNVSGNDGDDVVNGGAGKDIIIGGRGADKMSGGSEQDEYWFLADFGHDVISDFNVHEDRLDFHRYIWETGPLSIEDIRQEAEDTVRGVKLWIGGNSILLEGVSRSQLFDNASKIFILKDRVFERDNLILTADGVVLDAGASAPVVNVKLESQAGAYNGALVVEVTGEDGSSETVVLTDSYDANIGRDFSLTLAAGDSIRIGITTNPGYTVWSDSGSVRSQLRGDSSVKLFFEDDGGTDFDDVIATATLTGKAELRLVDSILGELEEAEAEAEVEPENEVDTAAKNKTFLDPIRGVIDGIFGKIFG